MEIGLLLVEGLAGADLGQRPIRALDGVGGLGGGRHPDDVLVGGAGGGGVRQPVRAGLIDPLQLGSAPVEQAGQRVGVRRLGVQPRAVVRVRGGDGFGGAQGRGLPVVLGGLAGAGELVGDVAGRPGRLAVVRANPHAQLPVGQLELLAVDLRTAEDAPGRAVGGLGLDLPGLWCRAERVGRVGVPA
jgi:hypothetical protein